MFSTNPLSHEIAVAEVNRCVTVPNQPHWDMQPWPCVVVVVIGVADAVIHTVALVCIQAVLSDRCGSD